MRSFVVPALAAICLSSVSTAPAVAAEMTVKVAYSDLDLATDAGRITLENRINAAIKTACARPLVIRDLKAMQAWEGCKADASASAYEQLEETVRVAQL